MEKLVGSEAKMDFNQTAGVYSAWVDTIIRSEVIMPIEIKPDMEYIIFEYETNTEFIGCKTILRIPVVEGYPELFPNEEITVKRTPQDLGTFYPWLYSLPKEEDSYDFPLTPTMAFRITKEKDSKITYVLQTKRKIALPNAYKLIVFIQGYSVYPGLSLTA